MMVIEKKRTIPRQGKRQAPTPHRLSPCPYRFRPTIAGPVRILGGCDIAGNVVGARGLGGGLALALPGDPPPPQYPQMSALVGARGPRACPVAGLYGHIQSTFLRRVHENRYSRRLPGGCEDARLLSKARWTSSHHFARTYRRPQSSGGPPARSRGAGANSRTHSHQRGAAGALAGAAPHRTNG